MKLFLLYFLIGLVKSDSTKLSNYESVVIADTDTACSYFENASISVACREQFEIVCSNSNLLLTMLDASSKFPYPGLTFSTRLDLGNFDQCMTIDHIYDGGRILGEHCAIGLVIPDIINFTTAFENLFKLAVCRPDACFASDYNAILRDALSVENFTGLFQDISCQTAESNSEYRVGDIIVLTIFAIVAVLMIVSSVYDIYLYKNNSKNRHPLFLAFSVLSNGRKLMHISRHSTAKEQIEVFHGIRVISMMWIVAGHDWNLWLYYPVVNLDTVSTWSSRLSSFYMTSAPLSVDTFFFMSGFLLAYQYFKGNIKPFLDQVLSIPHMIIHRYLRLTPALLMIYLVTITFVIHIGSGPLWTIAHEAFATTCKNNWWKVFLYIQNYYEFSDMCLMQTWYLSADMQLFLISPLILIPVSLYLKRFGFKSTMWVLLGLNIFWTILPMVLKLVIRSYTNEYDTHSRLVDYFIGAMLGMFMRLKIDKPFLYFLNEKYRSIVNLFIWVIVFLGLLTVLICYQDQLLNHGFESLTVFQSLMRPAWCIGLSWITYSCYHGYGGFIKWILCRPIFQVIGRLTYCIYLLHITVIMVGVGSLRTKSFFSEYQAFYHFCGAYIVTFIAAIFWTLAFESPLIIIEKYILGRGRASERENPRKNGEIPYVTKASGVPA